MRAQFEREKTCRSGTKKKRMRKIVMQRKKTLSGVKSLIRSGEGLLEIIILTVIYYFIFRNGYDGQLFPDYARYPPCSGP